MIFGIHSSSSKLLNREASFKIQSQEYVLHVGLSSTANRGKLVMEQNNFLFTSEQPYVRNNESYGIINDSELLLENISKQAENNFAGFQFRKEDSGWKCCLTSARITRARIYYILLKDGILCSEDLRELLPYSNRKLNKDGAFSILKYGDVPEFITVIDDIFCVPVGQQLTFGEDELNAWCIAGSIPSSAFKFFFKLDFPMDGGNIPKTEKLMEAQFSFIATLNPLVPISGGVDSTLANCLIDKFIDQAYPAYYIQFGDDDPEVKFAKEAAKASKAELEIAVFRPEDTIPSFAYQTEHSIQPIGESSTISTAYFFKKTGLNGHKVIDGTLADGCYGSTNYNRNVIGDLPERPVWQQRVNEWIAAQLQSRKLPGFEKFHPRDSYMNDPFMQFMDVYLGPFGNMWLKDSKQISERLLPLWQYYYSFLKAESKNQDDWMKYSVFKMVNYACKNNTAKSYDNSQPANSGLYPFTWLSILEDQGHYSWAEKTMENTIKYPLKKILSAYMNRDFIYRKKVGLNSCFEDWIQLPELKSHFSKCLAKTDGVAAYFLANRRKYLLSLYLKNEPIHPNLARLVINLSILDAWLEKHQVSI
ncbi:MAG: hypothetical protein K9G41_03520 [Flavobacteriales bacterium]|nr:hypothetical protein [Flavobacteriales bacterium]